MRRLFVAATLAAAVIFAVTLTSPVFADTDPTVDQIYAAVQGGHLDQAQQMISQVLPITPTAAARITCRPNCMPEKAKRLSLGRNSAPPNN